MRPWQKRATVVGLGIVVLGIASALVVNALGSNASMYITSSEVNAGKSPQGRAFRIGGLVKTGSLRREGLATTFIVTDTASDVVVRYTGILPDLFKEGRGVVVGGKLQDQHIFIASEVLAKHDENYMPPPALDAVNRANAAQQTTVRQQNGVINGLQK